MAKTILIVDDDPTQRRLMQAVLEKQGHHPEMAESGEAGLERIRRGGIDVVLLDLVMPGMDGQETLEVIKAREPDLPVIVLTAHGGIETVVKAMRAGAVDFFVKPASPERIAVSIRNAFKVRDLAGEVTRLKRAQSGQLGFKDMIASAPAMRQVVRLGERAAKSNIPILITGESGVGKELVARSIMAASDRAGRPFVAVNCGAIPENLVESTLFGHEKGAFTGAVAKHMGKFQEADGGTLFLDEIGELPLDMQVKLLRALQEGEVDPVGGKKPVKVDVRIISATNRDLAEQVKCGAFREDLFYRLNVVNLQLPALRERPADILALADHFSARYAKANGLAPKALSTEARGFLTRHRWSGNVRELENTMHRAVLLSTADEIDVNAIRLPDGTKLDDAPLSGVAQKAAAAADAASRAFVGKTVAEVEQDLILQTLDHCFGNRTHAANILGISIRTLRNKLKEYGEQGVSIPTPGEARPQFG